MKKRKQKKKEDKFSAMEIFWLVLSAICLLIASRLTFTSGIEESRTYFFLSIIGALMFWLRNYIRKNKKE